MAFHSIGSNTHWTLHWLVFSFNKKACFVDSSNINVSPFNSHPLGVSSPLQFCITLPSPFLDVTLDLWVLWYHTSQGPIHSSRNNVRISNEIRSFYFYGWFCLIRSKWMDVCIVEFQVRLDPLAINWQNRYQLAWWATTNCKCCSRSTKLCPGNENKNKKVCCVGRSSNINGVFL
jgi:hypothetical protein